MVKDDMRTRLQSGPKVISLVSDSDDSDENPETTASSSATLEVRDRHGKPQVPSAVQNRPAPARMSMQPGSSRIAEMRPHTRPGPDPPANAITPPPKRLRPDTIMRATRETRFAEKRSHVSTDQTTSSGDSVLERTRKSQTISDSRRLLRDESQITITSSGTTNNG